MPDEVHEVQVVVVLGDDDQVVSAEYADDVSGDPECFFRQTLYECDRWAIGVLWVSNDLAEKLVVHGTIDQHFSDGYEAQAELVNSIPQQMSDESLWNEGH